MICVDPRLSVAPMMDWTDRHFRYLIRQISRKVVLYTEMIAAQALVFGNSEKFLSFDRQEHPLILQLGGCDPELLAKACQIAQPFCYDGINLNAGCPSERVRAGRFGAALRTDPALIAECLTAMKENSRVPVSLKTRIALQEMTQDNDGFDDLCQCVSLVRAAGCCDFIIHARKARLKGLSPKENRTIPVLNYPLVYRLKETFPQLSITINGDIDSLVSAQEHLKYVDGVMMGRSVYASPYLLAQADTKIFRQNTKIVSRQEIINLMLEYLDKNIRQGVRPHLIMRHWLNLFKGCNNAKEWRRTLTQTMFSENFNFKSVAETLNKVISSFEYTDRGL